ncbi:MAG: KpsF/GutQ family sugar-phosphate isomerase [Hyphomicrobiales bacterium]|nr:KpsF/GutQ family sugar-phosphate isomerase [Hyphomicrobiales bacterium]
MPLRAAPLDAETSDAVASALRTLAAEREGLEALSSALAGNLGQGLKQAVKLIGASKGRVIVSGMGKSGHVGRKIAATLASTGTPAYFVHPAEASHGDLGMIQPVDVVLALSWSGETAELADLLSYSRRFRIPLVAVTSERGSTLASEADIVLVLPKAREACPNRLAPTTSTTLQVVLGDALAIALLEARGFSARDFRVFHPGGQLGAQLRHVREVMHGGDQLPLAFENATIAEVIAVISAKGYGCAFMLDGDGKLTGIITDGDLRRHAGLPPKTRAATIMTRTPRTVSPEALLAEALEIMETAKINVLVIVEDERPIGLVHLLDLLRKGVA